MMDKTREIAGPDPGPAPCLGLWAEMRREAAALREAEPLLAPLLQDQILRHPRLDAALAHVLALRLDGGMLGADALQSLAQEAMACRPDIAACVAADIVATRDRDPACTGLIDPLLYYKGLHALLGYRVAHWLWGSGRKALARWLQSRVAQCLGVDIHPAARIGRGILLDHAHGVVVGETAVIEDDVSILHGVTLGGTGKECGDRHPRVRSGVLLGAGALILGGIEIGRGAKVGAGSVVLRSVPPHVTVAGSLARTVGVPSSLQPSLEMNHDVDPGTATRDKDARDCLPL